LARVLNGRLRIFAASPGDTREERARLAIVVDELNRGIAAEKDVVRGRSA